MKKVNQTKLKSSGKRILLSYLTPQEKHRLVGSFVVENFWDSFIQQNLESINIFRGIAKKSIQVFIESYQDVWDYVVGINRLDDLFLTKSISINKVFKGLSVTELKIANKLLSLGLYSELEKDCLMALNKTILSELAADLKDKYKFSDEEFQLLMTPSFETFFTKYHFDHFEYAINKDPNTKDAQAAQLINDYHANDPELFKLRFSDMHFPNGDNLKDLLASQKNSLADKTAKKLKFIGNKDDLKAFEKLLEYDNFLDFRYRYNLEACPEYYVRKLLFPACQTAGIFIGVEKPLTLSDSEFIEGVNKLIGLVEARYIIEVEAGLIFNNSDNLTELTQISIEGAVPEILNHLKQGSPCLIKSYEQKSTSKPLSSTMVIVGYEGDTLIAQNKDKELVKLTCKDLESFEEFVVFQKYNSEFIAEIDKSIEKFIARKPYLNRSSYETAFDN